ncbi:hypothetical protein Cus16_3215 [Curtobacterium sp. ER1/6]|nr:hypothetical protein Cus16_3215 [Curtobacterium sp. ER1/6]
MCRAEGVGHHPQQPLPVRGRRGRVHDDAPHDGDRGVEVDAAAPDLGDELHAREVRHDRPAELLRGEVGAELPGPERQPEHVDDPADPLLVERRRGAGELAALQGEPDARAHDRIGAQQVRDALGRTDEGGQRRGVGVAHDGERAGVLLVDHAEREGELGREVEVQTRRRDAGATGHGGDRRGGVADPVELLGRGHQDLLTSFHGTSVADRRVGTRRHRPSRPTVSVSTRRAAPGSSAPPARPAGHDRGTSGAASRRATRRARPAARSARRGTC